MGDIFPRGRVSVAGAATFGVGEMPGHSTIEMAGKAVQLALADAAINLPEVDGLFIALMREVGLVEVARTGVVAIARGAEAV